RSQQPGGASSAAGRRAGKTQIHEGGAIVQSRCGFRRGDVRIDFTLRRLADCRGAHQSPDTNDEMKSPHVAPFLVLARIALARDRYNAARWHAAAQEQASRQALPALVAGLLVGRTLPQADVVSIRQADSELVAGFDQLAVPVDRQISDFFGCVDGAAM